MSNPSILVVGAVSAELAVHVNKPFNTGQALPGSDLKTIPDGKGANIAVAASRLGAKTKIIAKIGNDQFGRYLINHLADEGIDIECVSICNDLPSGTNLSIVDQAGENSSVLVSGANSALCPDDIFGCEHAFAQADAVILELSIPRQTILAAMDLARRHNCIIFLDPANAPADLPDSLLEVDYLTANIASAESITAERPNSDQTDKLVASMLIARGARTVALKLSSRGSLIVASDGHMYRCPAYRTNVIDTTAAGDAYTSALAYCISSGHNLHESARFATAAGSIACTKIGAHNAMPTKLEVEMLMRDEPGK